MKRILTDLLILVPAALSLLMHGVSAQSSLTVVISNRVAGFTPEIVGYNAGHFLPGSNTSDWWRYSKVNGARLWSSPSTIEPAGDDDNGLWGDGVSESAGFLARRSALRSDPLNEDFINWTYFIDRFENRTTSGNRARIAYALDELTSRDIQVNAIIQRSNTAFPFAAAGSATGWADRWEHWQHYYAQSFYMARHFGVQRFQMYNEPDHSSKSITQADFLERLQLASDAIHSAISDVNAMFGKSLVAQVQAPVTAGSDADFGPRPGGDPRDDTTGWGELVVQNRHTDLFGNPDPSADVFQTYAYQQYNASGPGFGSDAETLRQLIDDESGHEAIKLALTEFNVHTASRFDSILETLDSPSKIARFGSIFANLANRDLDEMYVFKFSQTDNNPSGGIKKNGTHFVSNSTSPYNIGGVTKGGDVVQMFAKGFAGAHHLLDAPQATGTGAGNLHFSAARRTDRDELQLFSANENESDVDLTIDLTRWRVDPGTMVMVEEVSDRYHAEVTQLIEVPTSRVITVRQSAESVALLTVPKHPAAELITLGVTDDVMVKSGVNSGQNYGDSDNLWVKSHSTNANRRNVSFLQFDLGAAQPADVLRAVLQVHGENPGSSAAVVGHVYGILDDSWDETSLTWENAPNLPAATGVVIDEIADNFVEEIGTTAFFVGHLTADAELSELMLDVTPFVQQHADRQVSFMMVREVRFDGDVDDDAGFLRFSSKEDSLSPGPQLSLWMNRMILPGDFNGSGAYEAEDIDLLCAQLGGGDLAFDLNGDGVVDPFDLDELILNHMDTHYGDANLDGVVDTSDFNLWNSHKFTAGTGWASGDFDCNGVTDTSDFNVWNANKFRSGSAPTAVPEPRYCVSLLLVFLWLSVSFTVARSRTSSARPRPVRRAS